MPVWCRIAAVEIVIFLGSYAAAQVPAGGKVLEGVLGGDRAAGAWIVTSMVLAYSIAVALLRREAGWQDMIYDGMPGILAGIFVGIV
jgi:sodium/proline symporter